MYFPLNASFGVQPSRRGWGALFLNVHGTKMHLPTAKEAQEFFQSTEVEKRIDTS